ncbi:unnamed protein product, partial [marine sediment metagenome]
NNIITGTPKTLSNAELDRLDGLGGTIVTDDGEAVTSLEGAGLDIDSATLRVTPDGINQVQLAEAITFAATDLLDFTAFN